MIKRPSCELSPAGKAPHPDFVLVQQSSRSRPLAAQSGSRYGVEFRMNTKAVSAKLSNNNGLLSLIVIDSNDKSSAIDCNNLVLAAGPWTPATLGLLCVSGSLRRTLYSNNYGPSAMSINPKISTPAKSIPVE